jgi:GT2 family glycosyltransferase
MRTWQDSDMTRVAIILVNWNGWRDTIACVETCLALEGPSFRIIVCDNASADGSVDKIAEWAKGNAELARDPASPVKIATPRLPCGVVTLDRAAAERGEDGDGAELVIVCTGANLGFAGGNNVGLRWALAQNCTHAWLLNNDTVVPSNALTAMINTMAVDATIGLCGSLVIEYHAPCTVQAYAGSIDRRTFRGRHLAEGLAVSEATSLAVLQTEYPLQRWDALYPLGASMLASRNFLNEIGLMEESYFLFYEEADWVLRCNRRYRITISIGSHIFHKHGASIGSTTGHNSVRATSFLFRSRLLITRRFSPLRLPIVIIQMLKEVILALLRGRPAKLRAVTRVLTGRVKVPAR